MAISKQALLLCCALLPMLCFGQVNQREYLQKVLHNLQQIETASYRALKESYAHGDTIPQIQHIFVREYNNPADTTIGANSVSLSGDPLIVQFGYDGRVRAYVNHHDKEVVINDFSSYNLPFRPHASPFFNYTKNIINYALTTTDSIEIVLNQLQDHYYFAMTINEDLQVEFFGKAFKNPSKSWDSTSRYQIWINKSDDLPYKVRREMSHDTTVETLSEVTTSNQPTQFTLSDYFPAGYTVISSVQKRQQNERTKIDILNKKAPNWTLNDADGAPVSLSDFKNKVMLVNFTGIGCGACIESVPMLRELKTRFSEADFDVVAFETWGKKSHSLKVYMDNNNLNYKLIAGDTAITKAYLSDRAVPIFIILDQQHVVRHIFKGYAKTSTDEQIIKAIDELLKTN